jgi:hypothetical protein
MMREGKSLRRRGAAIAALVIALCVGAPELAGPAGAAAPRPASRTELQARVTTRPAAARTVRGAAASTRPAQTQPGAIARARAKRRAARAARQRKRRRAAKKRRASAKKKRTKRQRAAAKRRNAAKAKRVAARRKRNAAAAKKANGGGKSMSMIDWAEVSFFALLPFLAVAALLFGTDYQRKPRAPSRTRRKRSLVITPVSRKF